MNLNRLTLTGCVASAPQFSTTPRGDPLVRFDLAGTEQWCDSHGVARRRTQLHRIVVFTPSLVRLTDCCIAAGTQVYLEGRLNYHRINLADGRSNLQTEIVLYHDGGVLHILSSSPPLRAANRSV